MTHDHHHEKKPLAFFASPLHEEPQESHHDGSAPTGRHLSSGASEDLRKDTHATEAALPLNSTEDQGLHDLPAFRRHAESTNAELFFDLCTYSL